MKEENLIRTKSFEFALDILKYYQMSIRHFRDKVILFQLVKCGTSIGANIEEAIGAQSKKDFIHKLSISYKEARECHYWLRLFISSDYPNKDTAADLAEKCESLLRILGSILKTMKNNLEKT